MRIFLLALALVMAFSAPAQADKRIRTSAGGEGMDCRMEGQGFVNVNISGKESDILKIRPMMDAKIAEIETLAAEGKLGKVQLQSVNYSVNSNSSGGCGDSQADRTYQVYGNLNFEITPSEQASALAALLVEKGHNASFNVNMNRQCQ
jgi:hypothetical protein